MSKAASRLAQVKRERLRAPLRICIYGQESVGKSTLAAHAPAPIWFDVEDGSGRLEVARYPFRDGPGGHVPHTYQEIVTAIDDLATNDHDYQTLVIDTADRLEALMWKFMIERDGPSSKIKLTNIESYGFGKGFGMAVDEWRALCLRLDRLRVVKGMQIVLLGHTQIRTFKNPSGEDYDRYNLRLNEKAAGFIKEWADVVGFATFEEGGSSLEGDRPKGYSTGRRLLKLQRTAALDAKSRIPLPAEVELDLSDPWAPLAKALAEGSEVDAEKLKAQIAAEVLRLGAAVDGKKVAAFVKDAIANNDTASLMRCLVDLKKRNPSKEETSHV